VTIEQPVNRIKVPDVPGGKREQRAPQKRSAAPTTASPLQPSSTT